MREGRRGPPGAESLPPLPDALHEGYGADGPSSRHQRGREAGLPRVGQRPEGERGRRVGTRGRRVAGRWGHVAGGWGHVAGGWRVGTRRHGPRVSCGVCPAPCPRPCPPQVMLQLEKKLFDYPDQEVFRDGSTAVSSGRAPGATRALAPPRPPRPPEVEQHLAAGSAARPPSPVTPGSSWAQSPCPLPLRPPQPRA